jgi:PAS domain S-box-containing protein
MTSESDLKTCLAPKLPLSVLLVEDGPDDVELCLRVLRRAHFEPQVDVVSESPEFLERIQANTYDVILADYNLGSWTGLDVLEILRNEECDIPFILVTGALGDERAVECLKRGATDFVLKDRMERLPFAITRAIDERAERLERQRAERLVKDSEAKFRALANAIPKAVFVEQGTQCLYANQAAERITGYTSEELLTMNFWQLLLPSSRKSLIDDACMCHDEDRPSFHHKARILTKTGNVRQLDVTVSTFQIGGRLAALISAADVAEEHGASQRRVRDFEIPEIKTKIEKLASFVM